MRKNIITFNVRNITLKLKILTGHFTGKRKILIFSFIILMLSFVNITLYSSSNSVSALSYSSDVNIGFTFNPTLSLSVSGDLIIPNLTPGNSADSNSITVSIATNTAYGYTLTSTVGSNDNNNGNNSRNLVNSVDNNQIFTSLDYGSSVSDKTSFNDNTWGYSYSSDNGTTWKPYSGLPLYSDVNHSTVLYSTYDAASSISLDFKIAAKSSTTQASGEYTNIINFYAVSVPEPPLLYDIVQNMTKGTLADNNVKLSDTITQANSGVYTYDPAVYGTASDASNDYNIYFYRGILDTDAGLGTYGSDGMADAWPNYVKLGNNTCWRIVRTTGSGGVKMIYNGLYGTTIVGSCANSTVKAQTSYVAFNDINNIDYKSIISIGYTFNGNYKTTIEDTAYDILFGTNENYSGNNTNSTIKDYLENSWFPNSMSIYESILETSAGFCNDRSIYGSPNVISSPYTNSSSGISNYRFMANQRNIWLNVPAPTLGCNRNVADLYTTISAINGNHQLLKPTALLTADEASLSGSGYANNFSGNSYLCSGGAIWLLSPLSRNSRGETDGIRLNGSGYLDNSEIRWSYGVRPVISLMHHIQVTGGNGTATSPWTIE